MKRRIIGLLLVVAVIVGSVVYVTVRDRTTVTTLNGYLGGEKIGIFEDLEIQEILRKKYQLDLDYLKAGSIDMVSADHTGRNYLFPASQTALELYEMQHGKPSQSEIIFNTPIVLYTWQEVLDAFIDEGFVTEQNGVYAIDLLQLVEAIEAKMTWEDIGLPEYYRHISVGTTDPTKSNSGNMFAGLLANTLVGGTASMSNVREVLPRLESIFERLGYMESSSADIFNSFIKTGTRPLIAGYENQVLEYALEDPARWDKIKDDIVLLYPSPTVWSSHVYIALDEPGRRGIEGLLDPEVQRLAWEAHGFRMSAQDLSVEADRFGVRGLAPRVTQVAPMPDAETMDLIIKTLS